VKILHHVRDLQSALILSGREVTHDDARASTDSYTLPCQSVSISANVTYTMNQDLASVQPGFLDPIASIGNGGSEWIVSIVPDSQDIQPGPISSVAAMKLW
jgi:hypothetical protein